MNKLNSYSKIYQLGHRETLGIFAAGPVIVEEKVDGSQFSFGVKNGYLQTRSRNNVPYDEQGGGSGDKMFVTANDIVKNLKPKLMSGWTYRSEYLSKPKHNTLCYDRVPKNHLVILDIDRGDNDYLTYEEKKEEAERLGFEVAPLIFEGRFDSSQDMLKLLDRVSFLGGSKIEGMVFKQYEMLDLTGKVVMAKFVSEAFKEIHIKDWKGKRPGQNDIILLLADELRTSARWDKALQHLKERGQLKDEPSDIGLLVNEVQLDTMEEGLDHITQRLLKWAIPQLKKRIVYGLPEWYKGLLAQKVDNALSRVSEDGDESGEQATEVG